MPKNTILNYFSKQRSTSSSPGSRVTSPSSGPQVTAAEKSGKENESDSNNLPAVKEALAAAPKPQVIGVTGDGDKSFDCKDDDASDSSPKSGVLGLKGGRGNVSSPISGGFFSPKSGLATPKRLSTPKSSPASRRSLGLTPKRDDKQSNRASLGNDGKGDVLSGGDGRGNGECFPHTEWPFLNNPKDASGRAPNHPEYDPRTLKVPTSFLDSQTPAQRQWWQIKSQNYDTLLFFKMGKFYELFHMDAITAVRECGLIFMKKDYAHCGFPEAAFQRYANMLLDKGFKVARIEQVETPKMMENRCKNLAKATKFDKVVRREICQKVTAGTRTFAESEEDVLVAVSEDSVGVVGVTVLNATLARLYVGQFRDDSNKSRTATLLSYLNGSEILFCKISSSLQKVVSASYFLRKTKVSFPDISQSVLTLKENLSSEQKIVKKLIEQESSSSGLCRDPWLVSLCMVAEYLTEAMIEKKIFQFNEIFDLDQLTTDSSSCGKVMVMYGATFTNLNVIPMDKKGDTFNLFSLLNHTCSPFGKRLLRQWVCNPLAEASSIEIRQTAINFLCDSKGDLVSRCRKSLSKMCDFDRYIAWIFADCAKMGVAEEEAVFYDRNQKAKASVSRLLACLEALEQGIKLLKFIQKEEEEEEASSLTKAIKVPNLERVRDLFTDFRNSFDFEEAAASRRICPQPGVSPDFDKAQARIEEIENEAEEYLKDQRKFFRSDNVSFAGSGPNRYQLEVPESARHSVTSEYVSSSQRKGFKRYLTDTCQQLREDMIAAEEELEDKRARSTAVVFERFCRHRADWKRLVSSLASLDCLLSLHQYSMNLEDDQSCFPTFEDECVLSIRCGRHPLLLACSQQQKPLIPNDVDLDGGVPMVLTGANMGGKSTVMRQTAMIVILAQLGCKVPATEMRFRPVDRLFTRMGASDDPLAGASTFSQELSEAAQMLHECTPSSLLLLDELGRGTSTHDGCAIARAVLGHFVEKKNACRIMFTTHYHQLVRHFQGLSSVRFYHMAILDPGENQPLTFLYKLLSGTSPKSHGFNAAISAGVPRSVVDRAKQVAKRMELVMQP